MFFDFKVFIKYVLGYLNFFFLRFSSKDRNGFFYLLLSQRNLYFFFLHVRLSSRFFFYQLVDLFAYELATSQVLYTSSQGAPKASSSTVLVYNFHGCKLQERLLVFSFLKDRLASFTSLVELYPNCSWLEREVGEFHMVCFEGKKDVRNLMLAYGESNAPFRKSFPSIGTRELFYDGLNDVLVQETVSTQI